MNEHTINWDSNPKGEEYGDDQHHCSYPDCHKTGEDEWGMLLYFTVSIAEGEEGYSEVTQCFCEDHFAIIRAVLQHVGFKSHRHGSIVFLEDDSCPGSSSMASCPHGNLEYGPELVQ